MVTTPGGPEEKLMKELQTSDMVFDQSQRSFGNKAGVGLLQELRNIREENREFRSRIEESNRRIEESNRESQKRIDRTYRAAMMSVMTLRAPIYHLHSGGQIGPEYRRRRNAVAHGGSVLTDISILHYLDDTAAFTRWATRFEEIYCMPFRYTQTLSESSKMVVLLNIHADVLLLGTYSTYQNSEEIKRKCKSIIRLWKNAFDTQRDPNGIFEEAAVAKVYDSIVQWFYAV
ncbi:hypothetical protein MaudCBS49596_003529 [Microsporum audouinii]